MGKLSKANFYLKLFGIFKIPLLFYCRAKIVALDENKTVIRIPFRRPVKNHLNSMYFGALAIGADIAGAYIAFQIIEESKKKISLVFKNVQGEFLKRVEGDAYFTCSDGAKIRALIDETLKTGERVEDSVNISVTCPDIFGEEEVARFVLTISVRYKPSLK